MGPTLGGIKQATNVAGHFEGFPLYLLALFGLVI